MRSCGCMRWVKSSDSNWHPLSVEMDERVPKRATSNPTRDEGSGNSLSCDIWDRDGFRPMSEAVNTGEQICMSPGGWEASNKTDVDEVKVNVRGVTVCRCALEC